MNIVLYTSLSVLAACISISSAMKEATSIGPLVAALLRSNFNILVLVNLTYNVLFLFGLLLQKIFFGQLREIEAKNMSERLIQYVLYKIIFIIAINMEPNLRDLLVWSTWFSILGFMKIFSMLVRDRFEYIVTFTPNAPYSVHGKLLTLLSFILLCDIGWFYFCVSIFSDHGASLLLLLTFECFTLFLDTVQTLIKYIIHLVDVSREGLWEQRGTYIYYTEFSTDTLILAATLGHYVQILVMNGVSFSLIDIVLFLHMRLVFNRLRDKIVSYKNYRRLAQDMKDKYLDVSADELVALDDVCAVCHDKMETAKKLPCGHIFHRSCLRSWLEHHSNCPTCRHSLIENHHQEPAQRNRGEREPVWQFQGPRWFAWLPQIQIVAERRAVHPHFVVSPEMIASVQDIVGTHVPAHVIRQELLRTQDPQETVMNFVEGRVVFEPQPQPQPQPFHPQPPAQQHPQTFQTPQPSVQSTRQSPSVQQSVSTPINPTSIDVGRYADTFKSTPKERELSLRQRKQQMLEHARKLALAKQARETQGSMEDPGEQAVETPEPSQLERSSTPMTLEERKRLMLEAAERRRQQNNNNENDADNEDKKRL